MQIETWTITGEGFHFGQHGLGQEETGVAFPSDSLFSALVARLSEIGGKEAVKRFMEPFLAGDPPFVISSCFPFAGSVRFFPALAQPAKLMGNTVRPKDLKKVKYLSEDLFRSLMDSSSLEALYLVAHKLQGKSLLVNPQEVDLLPKGLRSEGAPVWSVEQRPRVTLSRASQNSTIFFTGRVAYAEACGLWFGIRWMRDDPASKALITSLLADLEHSGLGGERSAGFGACHIETAGRLELPDPGRNRWVTLSRYLPRPDEMAAMLDNRAAYRMEHLVGWVGSPTQKGQRRRPLNLVAEGTVLGPLIRPVPGQVVDVRPTYPGNPDPIGHAVYRYGLALAVGLEGGQP